MAAIQVKNFEQASNELPSKIEKSFEVPKIWEMVRATGEASVTEFIQFELIKLAERINVSGNLTPSQIFEIAREIVSEYPNETIADFKICFHRAANGHYGKVWKLDGIEVGLWIKSFLEDKYKVLEDELMKEKESFHNRIFKNSESDWLQLWKEAIDKADEQGGTKTMSANLRMLSNLRGYSDEQTKENGQEKPKRQSYPVTSESERLKHERHLQYIRENYDARTGDPIKGVWVKESDWQINNGYVEQ